MNQFLYFIDRFSAWVGKSFAWCILVLALATTYEVFVRYVLRDPTSWAFDISYIMYGTLFMMAGGAWLTSLGLTERLLTGGLMMLGAARRRALA